MFTWRQPQAKLVGDSRVTLYDGEKGTGRIDSRCARPDLAPFREAESSNQVGTRFQISLSARLRPPIRTSTIEGFRQPQHNAPIK